MSPGSIDDAVIRRHLMALDGALQNLERHRGHPLAELEQELDERWAVLHGLQLCCQNALDIATHLAAGLGREVAEYAGAIDVLAEMKILPAPFAIRFRAIAGFRNILVHGYLAVDASRVHAILNHELDDFREFAGHVETLLADNRK